MYRCVAASPPASSATGRLTVHVQVCCCFSTCLLSDRMTQCSRTGVLLLLHLPPLRPDDSVFTYRCVAASPPASSPTGRLSVHVHVLLSGNCDWMTHHSRTGVLLLLHLPPLRPDDSVSRTGVLLLLHLPPLRPDDSVFTYSCDAASPPASSTSGRLSVTYRCVAASPPASSLTGRLSVHIQVCCCFSTCLLSDRTTQCSHTGVLLLLHLPPLRPDDSVFTYRCYYLETATG